jgi:hypothetical protein
MTRSHRISTALPESVFEQLLQEAAVQGRSMSNLTAYIIETYLKKINQPIN